MKRTLPASRASIAALRPVCLQKNVGVIGMKGLGGSGASIVTKGAIGAVDAYRFALSQPVAAQVVGLSSADDLA
jgi:hypothetical protein